MRRFQYLFLLLLAVQPAHAETVLNRAAEKNHELVTKVIEKLKSGPRSKLALPATPSAILSARINGKPLSPAMRELFAFDMSFRSLVISEYPPMEASYLDPFGAEPTRLRFTPVTLDKVLREDINTFLEQRWENANLVDAEEKPIKDPKALVPVKLKASLFQLPQFGDESHFLYTGVPDEAGEFPVLGMKIDIDGLPDDREAEMPREIKVELFIKYASFTDYLAHTVLDSTSDADHERRITEVTERNPELKAIEKAP